MKKAILFAFLPFFSYGVYSQMKSQNLALTGVTIIDVHHTTPLAHQTVLVTGDKISGIFPDGSKSISDSFQTIPLRGKYLLPGLIDSHVHMATDPSDVDNRPATLKVLERMLYSGITSVRDMAGDARTLASLSRDALTGDIKSPNLYYSALMAGPAFFSDPRTATSTKGLIPGKVPFMLAVTDSTDLVRAVAEAKGCGATGIKLYANLSASLVRKIVLEANRQQMIVWGHAWLQDAKPSDLVGAGLRSISHASLMAHEIFKDIPAEWKQKPHSARFWDDSLPDLNELFQLMKEHHTILDATLLVYKRWSEEDSSSAYNYELAKRITARAYKAGVAICAGTDDDQKEFVQREMQLLVKDAGLSAMDAIIAATWNGAQVLGIDQARGSVEIGKVADLLILDKNPLETIENINSVVFVLKSGRILKKEP